jgi:hypothetical protein
VNCLAKEPYAGPATSANLLGKSAQALVACVGGIQPNREIRGFHVAGPDSRPVHPVLFLFDAEINVQGKPLDARKIK